MMPLFQNLNLGQRLLFRLGGVVGVLLLSGTAMACEASTDPQVGSPATHQAAPVNKTSGKASQDKLSDKRIEELLDFIQEHHSEVLPLLKFLKENRRKRFDVVMMGLERDVSKLERMKRRSLVAYQRGLSVWINRSKIQLYAAHYRIVPDEETATKIRKKIEVLINENLDSRILQLKEEKEFASGRAEQAQRAAENLMSMRESIVQKRIKIVTSNAPIMRQSKVDPAKELGKESAVNAVDAVGVDTE